MEPVNFSCQMCGEHHRKILPSSANITTCNRCGNLIELSSIMRNQNRNRNVFNNNNNRSSNNHYRSNFFNDNYNISNEDSIDDDFYNFNRYSGHNDILPSANNTNNRFNDSEYSSEFNDFNLDPFDINFNRDPLTLLNPTPLLSNILNNRPNFRSFSMRNNNNNRNNQNNNNNQPRGMFSIQIPNDRYDSSSAFYHRSGFGYRGEDNFLHNFNDINFDDELENEISRDIDLMSRLDARRNNNPSQPRLGIIGSFIIQPQKPKIKLQKIKMCKDLNVKNDGNINEQPVCCICLAPMKINQDVTLLKCQHLFHYKCLDQWVQNKEACPFCRGKIEFATVIKKVEDKKVEDKKVEDKKVEDKKVEDKKVENKKVNDKKNNAKDKRNLNKNFGELNRIGVRPVLGNRKTNIIRANNNILNNRK